MRPFKFQLFDKDAGIMREVLDIHFQDNYATCKDGSDIFHYDLDVYPLRQFTGLLDRNGKKIYEGDIIKQTYHAVTGSYDDGITFDGHHIGQIVITARKGVCMRNPLCYSEETDETTRSNQYKNVAGYRCEVIGNIYEHPHLLEVAADGR